MSRWIPVLVACVSCAAFLTQAARWNRTHTARGDAQRAYQLAAADVAELQRLRSSQATSLFGEPPDEDINARVAACLASIALPESIATSIKRESDRAVSTNPHNRNRRQRDVRIELRPISPAGLGRFLAAWGEQNPAWAVGQISLRKITDRRAGPEEYHVTLSCSAEYTSGESKP